MTVKDFLKVETDREITIYTVGGFYCCVPFVPEDIMACEVKSISVDSNCNLELYVITEYNGK